MSDYEELEDRIYKWADNNAHILAVVVIGSRSRSIHPADTFSDLDLIVFTNQPEKFDSNSNWLTEIDDVWIAFKSVTGKNHPEWFVLFQGGLKADFVVIESNSNTNLSRLLAAAPYQDIFRLGIRVLFSQVGNNKKIRFANDSQSLSFTDKDLQLLVDKILMKAARTAIFIKRGELWQSQIGMAQIRNQILELITIHADVSETSVEKIRYDGRYIHEWVQSWIIAKLPTLFPGYSAEELKESVQAALKLMNSLALDISSLLEGNYPTPGQQAALSWIAGILINRSL